jgi:phospholipid/cholesterol/gamma-HCH transport system permease protein
VTEATQPAPPAAPATPPPEPLHQVVQQEIIHVASQLPFSERARRFLLEMGETGILLGQALARAVRPPYAVRDIAYQVEVLGVRSLSIATLTAVFAGLVLSLQFAFFLARFGVQHTVGKVLVLTLFRELGPVLTALTVGARIGSGIAAELGSMTVTEQVDAIRALGADPVRKLVVPRLVACAVVLPTLTALADVFGLVAGSAVVWFQYEIPLRAFYRSVVETANLMDFGSGIAKSAVFGVIIGIVGCHQGFKVSGGTEGVGRATTETVAIASVAVCLCDFFLTKLFMAL